ncbi:hypothetical protein CU098_002770, partial [Rhizopus stolonifer]
MSASIIDPFRKRVSQPFELNQHQLQALIALLDTFIAPLSQNQINQILIDLKSTHTPQEIIRFCQISSSGLGSAQATLRFIDNTILPEKRLELAKFLSILSTRPGTFILTGHLVEFSQLSLEDRERAVLSWKDSYLPALRGLYKSFVALACHPAFKEYPELLEAMHYDLKKEVVYDPVYERLPMMIHDKQDLHFDAIVVGSGGGGGVVAGQLAKSGKSVLVIEKGGYFHEDDFLHQEKNGYNNLYENGGFSPSLSGSISIVAGSVFGGGTTPPHYVREEWAKQGLSYFTSPKFSKDLDRVFERIGATTEGIKHNGSNQVLVDGCKSLGFPVSDIAQNTNGKPHECNFCFAGCRAGIKNGTMNTWLRDAHEHGAKFLEKTKVKRVIIENGKAVGVECLINYENKVKFRADQVIVSAGSLQSPGILLRSGLKNKQIGKNLFLHPCSIIFGYFDKKIKTHQGSIMTAVCNVAENTERDGYGCRLEVPCLHPSSYASVVPWRGAADHKKKMMQYDQCAPILILARDKDSKGTVYYDKDENNVVDYSLSARDRRSITEGIVRATEILVAAGAREVLSSQFAIEPFKFDTDEEPRVDNPRFIAWRDSVARHGFPDEGANAFCAHQMGT